MFHQTRDIFMLGFGGRAVAGVGIVRALRQILGAVAAADIVRKSTQQPSLVRLCPTLLGPVERERPPILARDRRAVIQLLVH